MLLTELDIRQNTGENILSSLDQLIARHNYQSDLRDAVIMDQTGSFSAIRLKAVTGGYPLYYVNSYLEDPIRSVKPKRKSGVLASQLVGTIKQISPFNPISGVDKSFLANAVVVDTYGRAHFIGAKGKQDPMNIIMPGVGACLAVMIRDNHGNVTAAHHGIAEQYSQVTVRKDLEAHVSTFGAFKSCLIGLAGLGLTEKGLTVFRQKYPYKDLQEIVPTALEFVLRDTMPGIVFKTIIAAGRWGQKNPNSLLTTDMLTINQPRSPIVYNQYWFNYPPGAL